MSPSNSRIATEETSGPLARPPIVYAGALASGLALHWAWPVSAIPLSGSAPLGALLAFAAGGLFALAVREFRRFETPIPSTRPSRTVVKTGPYRRSHQPNRKHRPRFPCHPEQPAAIC